MTHTPRPFYRFALALLPTMAAAVLAACGSLPAGSRTVQIERTAYGIAHITAEDYEGLAYGTAYAYAQDNMCGLAQQLVTVRGDRSRYFGPTAVGLLGLRTLPNAQIDLFIRGHMDDAALAHAHAALAYGLLTYGQGSYTESAHAYDQLPLFAAKQWVRLPFHPQEVKAQRVGEPLVLAC